MGWLEVNISCPNVHNGGMSFGVDPKAAAEVTAAVKAVTNGFGGPLEVLVGFDEAGNILGYTILATVETPGLGVKADTWFQKGGKGDIIGKNPGQKELLVTKDGGDIDAITASTITSRAFLNAVNQAYKAFMGNSGDAMTGASTQAGKSNQ